MMYLFRGGVGWFYHLRFKNRASYGTRELFSFYEARKRV